jgi:hypothetical protein
MKPSDVIELTIAEIEELFNGFSDANKETSGESKDTLKGSDAIKFLMDSGGNL